MAVELNAAFSEPIGHSFSAEDSSVLTTALSSPAFRADTDQSGEWYVWTRIGRSAGPTPARGGWATMQRCDSRELAQRLADDLNQRSLRVAV